MVEGSFTLETYSLVELQRLHDIHWVLEETHNVIPVTNALVSSLYMCYTVNFRPRASISIWTYT